MQTNLSTNVAAYITNVHSYICTYHMAAVTGMADSC